VLPVKTIKNVSNVLKTEFNQANAHVKPDTSRRKENVNLVDSNVKLVKTKLITVLIVSPTELLSQIVINAQLEDSTTTSTQNVKNVPNITKSVSNVTLMNVRNVVLTELPQPVSVTTDLLKSTDLVKNVNTLVTNVPEKPTPVLNVLTKPDKNSANVNALTDSMMMEKTTKNVRNVHSDV
jgi:hypothetical protein